MKIEVKEKEVKVVALMLDRPNSAGAEQQLPPVSCCMTCLRTFTSVQTSNQFLKNARLSGVNCVSIRSGQH